MEFTVSSWSAMSSMQQTTNEQCAQPEPPGRERDQTVSTDPQLADFTLSGNAMTPRTSELLILGLKYRERLLALGNVTGEFAISDAQVEFIGSLRKQRELATMLPPVTDAFSLRLRMEQMEKAEFAHWKEREAQMQEVSEKRLALIRQVLTKYLDEHVYARIRQKVSQVRDCKETEINNFVVTCERSRNKILRKPKTAQLRTMHKLNRMGSVGKDKQLTHLRVLHKLDCFATVEDMEKLARPQDKFEVQVQDLQTIEGLSAVAGSLPKLRRPTDLLEKERPAEKEMLEEALKLIKTEINWRARVKAENVMRRTQQQTDQQFAPLARADTGDSGGKEETPRIDRPKGLTEDEAQIWARGEMRKAEMQKSLETRKLLIAELRAVEKETEFVYSDRTLEEVEKTIGSVVSQALDDLNKELIRLEEEQRLATAVFGIVRERRMKEAEEAGRRQQEELRRDREDEIFRQVMQVNRGTVSSYIEQIVGDTIQSMIGNNTAIPEEPAVEVVDRTDAEVVVDVVEKFLFPHIDRLELQRILAAKHAAIIRVTASSLAALVRHSHHNN